MNDQPADLGEPQQRLVLALLLAQAGSVVSTDRLVDDIWGDAPPLSARKLVQGYVSGLRRALGPGAVIESRAPGYRLTADRGDVDASLFADLVAEASDKITSDAGRAGGILREALAMWRGAPYEDLADYGALRPEIVRLEALHMTAVQLRIEAEIHGDGALLVVAELADLTGRHPLEERLWALRMLALYRSGRQADALRAFDEARRILVEQVGLEPSAELRLVQRRVLDQDPVLETARALSADRLPDGKARNPYKGLRTFDESDAADFYGRDDLVRRIQEAVDRRVVPRLVVVAGPSGCGKSSVVRAGLFPLLRARGWRLGAMYPGSEAVGALEATLAEVGGATSGLILVDQLEEVQTGGADGDERAVFLDRLSEIAGAPDGPWVVATVRTDFLDGLLAHLRFARLVEGSLVLVAPLDEFEVRDVVTRPALRAGVRVDPELTAAMAADVADRPSALPLLEFALTDLYDRSGGGALTLDAYRAAGGIAGSLVQRAEELFGGLGAAAHEATRLLFLQLTGLSEDGHPVRRRRPQAALAGIPGIEAILEQFGRHRLLTFDRDAAGQPTVEVAHETLLTEWPRLRTWIDSARESIRLHRHLSDATAEWEAGQRDAAFLLTGPRLARFADQPLADVALGADEHEFLQRSRTADRRRRRRRSFVAWGSVAVFASLAAVALVQWQAAQREARNANVRRLAAESTQALVEDPELGILLALEGVEISSRAGERPLREAVSALHTAVQASRLEARLDGGTLNVAYSPDGSLLVTDMPNPTEGLPTGEVVVWDAATRLPLRSLVAGANVGSVDNRTAAGGGEGRAFAFSPDGLRLAVAYQTAAGLTAPVIVWDPRTGERLAELVMSGWVAWDPAWSADGEFLTVAGWDGGDTDVVTTWEVSSGREVSSFRPGLVGGLAAYRADTIAVGELRGRVGIYDVHSGEEVDALETPGLAPKHLVADVVGGLFLLDGGDQIQAWDMDARALRWSGPGLSARDIALSPDGTTAAFGGDGGLVRLVDLGDGSVVREFAVAAGVGGLAFAPGSDVLAVTDVRGTGLWDVSPGGSPALGAIEEAGGPWAFEFSPDGSEIAVATAAGTLQRRAVDRGTLLSEWGGLMADRGVYPVISQDWGTVALVTEAGAAEVRAFGSGELIRDLPPCMNPRALSPDGSAVLVDGWWLCNGAPPPGVDLRTRVIDTGSGSELADFGPVNVFRAAFNPAGTFEPGRYVAANWNGQDATGDFKDLLYVVDTTSGQAVLSLDIAPTVVAFDPTGQYLASGTFAGGVVVVDMAALVGGAAPADAIVMDATVDSGLVTGIALSTGGTLATAGLDSTSVRLWDWRTGDLVVEIPADAVGGPPPKLAFSPDGRYLLYTDAGNVLRKFLLDFDDLVELARSRLTRTLTDDECRRHLYLSRCP